MRSATSYRVPGPVRGLAATYVVLLLALLLVPSSDPPSWIIEQSTALGAAAGLPATVADARVTEVVLNVAAFAPLTVVGTLLRPALGWRDWTALAFVASVLVEVVQAAALPERTPSHSDVVANTLGALVGTLAARLVVRSRSPRPRPRPEP